MIHGSSSLLLDTLPRERPRDGGGSGVKDAGAAAALWAVTELVLTSVHHAYGAYIYHTPWRYHVVLVAGGTLVVMLVARAVSRRNGRPVVRSVAWWVFVATIAIVPVLLIGAFEGLYNHGLKDALFVGGAPVSLLKQLFPPPTYEMPSDSFFELTGVLQVFPAVLAALHLFRLVRSRLFNVS